MGINITETLQGRTGFSYLLGSIQGTQAIVALNMPALPMDVAHDVVMLAMIVKGLSDLVVFNENKPVSNIGSANGVLPKPKHV